MMPAFIPGVMRPAEFSLEQIPPLHRQPAELAKWFTRSGGFGEVGENFRMDLQEGGPVSGHVLAKTKTEVALSWDEIHGSLELKAFQMGPQKILCIRGCGWGLAPEQAKIIEAQMERAIDRLARALTTNEATGDHRRCHPEPNPARVGEGPRRKTQRGDTMEPRPGPAKEERRIELEILVRRRHRRGWLSDWERELLMKVHEQGVSFSVLSRQRGLRREVLSRWWIGYQQQGRAGLEPHSRRPIKARPGCCPRSSSRFYSCGIAVGASPDRLILGYRAQGRASRLPSVRTQPLTPAGATGRPGELLRLDELQLRHKTRALNGFSS